MKKKEAEKYILQKLLWDIVTCSYQFNPSGLLILVRQPPDPSDHPEEGDPRDPDLDQGAWLDLGLDPVDLGRGVDLQKVKLGRGWSPRWWRGWGRRP